MSLDADTVSWSDPTYVATLVGVFATAALIGYSEVVPSTPSVETILFVLLWVTAPMTVANVVAVRFLQ